MSGGPLLSVRGLKKHYPVTEGLLGREVERVRAVDGIDFDLRPGETLGLVGESGCGKSTVAATTLRLEEPTDGDIRFDGEDVTAYEGDDLKRFRRRAQLVFQDPNATFDPRMTVGEAVGEPLLIHGMGDPDRRRAIVEDLLERVGLSPDDADRYPHAFSGGQKQRIALARSLALDPDLLVADEPVSGLDVSVQASVLELMADLQETLDLSILFISHDMSVVREFCDRVAVMYLGEIVERGPIEAVFEDPAHPYTRALMEAIPSLEESEGPPPEPLSGDVPDPADPPSGCRFRTRCPVVVPPDDLGLDREAWRAVYDVRLALERDSFDREALEERVDATDGDGLRDGIREAFDLPLELADPGAESTLAAALDALASGDEGTAIARLRETFVSPCERRDPATVAVDQEREAACLRLGDFGDPEER
ncbi:MAG: oligopeptide/dipeptide ABC transporter ATP-binding protein [Halobacteriales archaeon]